MTPSNPEILATILFGLAVLHTFVVKRFERWALRYPEGSVGGNALHLLGEVEVVFGLWAAFLLLGIALLEGAERAIGYAEGLHFTEPVFVFAIMTIAATRPVLEVAARAVHGLARLLPVSPGLSFYFVALVVGPLLGSLITEPAAMTVTALLLRERYFQQSTSSAFKYASLGVLFVNVSIGGTLTHFAAPPVLMVAAKWGWGTEHMLATFGWKAALAVVVNALGACLLFRRELGRVAPSGSAHRAAGVQPVPWWLIAIHLAALGLVVLTAHHPVVFLGVFLLFLGFASVTSAYQDELQLREGLLVGFFLAGLVVLGGMQAWWLEPLLRSLDSLPLFLGATALTGVTDNAALTYLGAQVPGLSEISKYALLAGAVAGGGLTVIANAPNPAGYGLLRASFGPGGISPLGLFLAALGPTLVAMAFLWWMPSC